MPIVGATRFSGSPTLVLTVGTTDKTLTATNVTASPLVFTYDVVAADTDTDGVVVKANSLTVAANTIEDAAGNDLVTTFTAVNGGSSHAVDNTAPRVGTIAFTTTGPYTAGDTITISVPITDATATTLTTGGDSPTLTLVVGTTEKTLTSSTSAGTITALAFSYTVVAGDIDTDGVVVKANSLTLPTGTTVRDAVDQDLVTTFTAVNGGSSQTIDNTAPTVGTIAFTTTGPYTAGDTITISVSIVGATQFSGSPTLVLTVGTTDKTLTATNVTASPLVFTYNVVAGDTDTDGVVVKANSLTVAADTIEDAAGNDLVTTFTAVNGGTSHAVDNTAPTVGTISFTSTGPYTAGDTITLSVPLTDASDVALATGAGGAPTLTLVVGTTEKTLTSSTGAGTITALAFSYTVVAGDTDTDGVSVKANSLTLPSGTTIRDAVDLDLVTTFTAVNGGSSQAIDSTVPTVGTISFTSTGPYTAGDTITISVPIIGATQFSGSPTLVLTVGTTDKTLTATNVTASPLVFTYSVVAGDTDTDGVTVKANSLTVAADTIEDAAGNDLVTTFTAVNGGTSHAVDTTAPTVGTIAFTSTGPYKTGEAITISVPITDASAVTLATGTGGAPTLTLVVGTTERTLTSSTSAGTITALAFSYTVVAGDTDTDGVSVKANSLTLPSGTTVRDAVDLNLVTTFTAVNGGTSHAVDTTAPTVGTIAFTSTGPYTAGETITLSVPITDASAVALAGTGGAPTLVLTVGTTERTLTTTTTAGTITALAFSYTVVAGDTDTDGVSVKANSLTLPSGTTIRDAADQGLVTTFTAVAGGASHAVDNTAPTVGTIAFTTTGPYTAGNTITISVPITDASAVTLAGTGGAPTLTLVVGTTEKTLTSSTSAGTITALAFSYTVVAGDMDADGVSVKANSLTLPSGTTVRDAVDLDLVTTFSAVNGGSSHAIDNTAPTVGTIAFTTTGPYTAGDTITISVPIVGATAFSGSPTLVLTVGTTDKTLTATNITASPLVFSYTVVAGDTDTDGVTVKADSLTVAADTIEDAAGNDLVTTFSAVNGGSSHAVDNTAPTVGTIAFTSTGPYEAGDAITISVPLTDASAITLATGAGGAPTLTLVVGTTERTLTTRTAAGTITTLAFSYTVQAGDTDTNGVSVKANSLTLPSGTTVRDAVDLDLVTTFTAVAGGASQAIDSTAPTVGTIAFTTTGPYKAGDTITLSVPIMDASAITLATGDSGLPTLTLVVGMTEKTLTTTTAAGTITALAFSYTVVAGDTDTDGVSVKANSLTLPSGTTVQDALDQDLVTTFTAVNGGTSQAIDTTGPTVGMIAFTSTGPYTEGDAITLSVPLTDTSDITLATGTGGSPTLTLVIGTTERTLTTTTAAGEITALAFSYTVVAADTDTDGVSVKVDSLTLPSGTTIRDALSNDLVTTFTAVNGGASQTVDNTAPTVGTIAFTSTGPYTVGGMITISVPITDASAITLATGTDGAPTLTLVVGTTERTLTTRTAAGTITALAFSYTVQAGDADADGVSVKADSLTLPSGTTVRDAVDLDLVTTFSAVNGGTSQAVDTAAPGVGTISFTSTGPYTAGDTITISVPIVGATQFSGSPTLVLTVGTTDKTLTATNVTASPLVFTYSVVAGDTDTDGVVVKANSLTVAANTIEDAGGNDLVATFSAVNGGTSQTVDNTAPTVGTIAFTSTGPYKTGEAITISVPITDASAVTLATGTGGAPTLTLVVGTMEKTLTTSTAAGTITALAFSYTVVAGDTDTDGVSVKADSLTLPSGTTVRDAVDLDLVTTFTVVNGGASQAVDNTAPTVGTIAFTTTGPYKTGDTIGISVPITDTSAVTLATGAGGSPTLVLTVGTTDKTLTSSTSAGTITALAFSYTVVAGDTDTDGVSVKANSLTLPSGTTVRDAADNDLVTTFTAANGGTSQAVDTTAPTVGAIAFTSTGPYTAGDTITLSVPITDASAITLVTGAGGAPTLVLTVGTTERTLTTRTAAGTITTLAFSYTVVAGDTDTDGVSVKANSLTLPTGTTIRDAVDQGLVKTFTTVAGGASQAVDNTAPTVGTIAFTSTGPYTVGNTITLSVPITDASAVTLATGTGGSPTLTLIVGTTERTLTTRTAAGTITALAFSYTVQSGDTDTDGVSVKADSLTLPSGTTVRDAVDLDLVTTFSAVNGGTSQAVDTTAPGVGTISFTGTGPYTAGDTITVSVPIVGATRFSGSPTLVLTVGTTDKTLTATNVTASPLVFTYSVVAGDTDTDGVVVKANSLTVAANTIEDAGGNDLVATFSAVNGGTSHAVDTTAPTVGTIAFTTTGPYEAGETITLSVPITDASAVTLATGTGGSPTLTLVVGTAEKTLTTSTAAGTITALAFSYTVVAGDTDADGVSVKANSLTLPSGTTIRDAVDLDLVTTFATVAGGPSQVVNTTAPAAVDTTAPTVGTIAFTTTGPYTVGDTITISVPITDASAITLATGTGGAPTLTLIVGTAEKTLTTTTAAGTITALAFSYTVVAGDTDTDGVVVKANSLTLPTGTTIKDAARNDLVTTFTAVNGGTSQAVDTTAPTVGTISFTSTGPYKAGDAITISVPITDATAITLATGTNGAPTLVLTVGTTDKTLTASTSAGPITALAFSYTVVAGDADTDGVSVKANSLTLPSGTTVRDAVDLDLVTTFTTVAGGPSQAIDTTPPAVDTTAPTVGTISFTSTGPYTVDDTITLSVPITDASAITLATGTRGVPTLTLVVGTTEKTLTTTTAAGTITALAFSYRVVAGDTDTDGVSVKANSLTLPSGTTIRDTADLDLVTTFTAVAGGPSQVVDTTAPTVGTIAFTSTGPYTVGETITLSVPITDASAITLATGDGGAPTLTLVVGTTERTLTTTTAAGTITALAFSYTVVAGDMDTDGVSVKANSLTLPSGTTIRDAVDLDLVTTFTTVAGGPSQTVDTTTPVVDNDAPTVGTIAFTSTGPYTVGETITLSVPITDASAVTLATGTGGAPTLTLVVGTTERTLTTRTAAGTITALAFSYTVVAGDTDTDGVSVKANSLTLPSGTTIRDAVDLDLVPTFTAVNGGASHAVDTTAPTVGTISFTSTGPYTTGETITLSVPLTDASAVTLATGAGGAPRLTLVVGTTERTLTTTTAAGTITALAFSYTVVAGDTDTDGVSVKANSLRLPSGTTVRDAVDLDLVTTFTAVAGGPSQVVDTTPPAVDTTAPTVGTISFTSTGPYTTGETITLSVPITDASAITLATGAGGSPTLTLVVGTTEKTLTTRTAAGTITALAFSYTVVAGDTDTNGVSVKANSLTLPSGTTIRDAADLDLVTTFTTVAGGPSQMVDTTAPTVGTIAFTSTGPYTAGDTITLSVPIIDASAITLATGTGGAPTLTLVVGTTEKTLTSSTSAGTITALAFSYTVVAGDMDTDGVSVKANSLTLPTGTTIRDAVDLDLVTTFAAVNGGSSQTVDTTVPAMDTTPPTVGTISFTSTGPYTTGDTIRISVPITDTSAVTLATGTGGAPTLVLTVGTTDKTLTSSTSAGTITALAFSYTVVAGDTDTDGVSVKANSLTLPSGTTIRDAADQDLVTTFTAVNGGSSQVVDTTAPTVGTIAFTSTGPYTVGNIITLSVRITDASVVTLATGTGGVPTLTLIVGTTEKTLTTRTAAGRITTLAFSYTVVAGDTDTDGVVVKANSLTLPSGTTVRDAVDLDLVTTFTTVAGGASQAVDTTVPTGGGPWTGGPFVADNLEPLVCEVEPDAESVTSSQIVFNELLNAYHDKDDWIELKNVSEEAIALAEWEISIVEPEGEDADKDVDIVVFPEYTLPVGGILLIVNTDPSETRLAGGINIETGEAKKGARHLYFITADFKLPETPYLLILRRARDKNGQPEAIEDVTGTYFRNSFQHRTQGVAPQRHAATAEPCFAYTRDCVATGRNRQTRIFRRGMVPK